MDARHLDPEPLPFELISSDDQVVQVRGGMLCALKPGAACLTARLTMEGMTAEDRIGICVIAAE
jgi:hypothetical protein